MAMLDAGMTPKDIAEALDTHVSYVYTVKKARAEQAQPVSRSAKKANGNGNSNGHSNGDNQSQADKIRELLAQDVSVADIAKRLNTHPSYVYTVKNR
jgi:DNA-binding CsgD family transcriptional regulator